MDVSCGAWTNNQAHCAAPVVGLRGGSLGSSRNAYCTCKSRLVSCSGNLAWLDRLSVMYHRLNIGIRESLWLSCSASGQSSKSQIEMATTSVSLVYVSPALS